VRRRATLWAPAAVVLVGAVAVALLRPGAGAAFFGEPGGDARPTAGIRFVQSSTAAVVIDTPAYKLTIAKRNGAIVDLLDHSTGASLIRGTNGCEWGVGGPGGGAYVGGCSYTPGTASTFSYKWDAASTTLTMTYTAGADAEQHIDAVVTLHASQTWFDVQATVTNDAPRVIAGVNFPADLFGNTTTVQAGYAPNFLPGVRFTPSFFGHVGNDVFTYPGRWAFADYLALDVGGAHLAVYSVNPPPQPIAPVDLGFIHNATPAPCSGTAFCLTHVFHTWIEEGKSWTSPPVRFRIGDPVDQTILDYRADNGIDAYQTVAAKVGGRLATLAKAPLIKADLQKGAPRFADWPHAIADLPSPSLIHPVGFGPNGFDATDPDVLPPSSSAGTMNDLQAAVAAAHGTGDLVMPYLNVSWWNPQSPTVHDLPPPLTGPSVSVQDSSGTAAREQFSGFDGFIVSPSVPDVRKRSQDEIDTWSGQDVGADCLFFDQIGARPWRYDFNPDATSPLSYYDGWLSLFAPDASRCLMVEDGWDRLAASFSGFDSSVMLMQREFDWLDQRFGGGNWETFPLALWLLHDKVLLYQHDLFDGTFTGDPEMLTWNLAYGYLLSFNWSAGTSSPWLRIVAAFQQALGPHYAGVALTSYDEPEPGVTETRFGTYSVIANRTTAPYPVDGLTIAPGGFLARTDDGSLVAGELADASGPIYRIVENGQTTFQAPVPAPLPVPAPVPIPG
jgi:hypothetical protein